MSAEPAEIGRFNDWIRAASKDGNYTFETPRRGAQRTEVELEGEGGATLRCLNFSSYNYLGYGYHPEVLQAAKDALDRYGLGAASSPVISGTFQLHKQLEQKLVEF